MIKSDAELNVLLIIQFSEIVNEVVEKLLKELQRIITEEVYDAGTPSVDGYNRQGYNGGLIGSFESIDAFAKGQQIEAAIEQDAMSMTNSPDEFIHGSEYWTTNDIRDILSDIIIHGGSGASPRVGDLFGSSGFYYEPRDFWTPMIKLLTDGTADGFIEKAMSSRGIHWIKE